MQWEEFRYTIRHLSESDQAAVEKAYRIGERAHEGQKRKSGEPYFSHPIAVAGILADLGGDKETIVAGLLHDTVEDTSVTLLDIERDFGPGVATLIDGVTKLETVDIENKPGLDQQIETLRKMFTLMQKDVRIMVIKLADRMHNMQTIQFRSLESQVRIARETMDVYVKIADRLCMRDMQNALEALCLAVLEPELHARLLELRTAREAKGMNIATLVSETLAKDHAEAATNITVHYEQKSWYRMREQLKSQHERVTGMATIAVAIVCKDVDHCYRVLGGLHQEWQREILSFQDFINSPMINGYRGLHTTIILEDGTRVRCKIRTEEMQRYARRGITVFCFDSSAKGPLDYLPWTRRIAAISTDTHDRSDEFWEGLQNDILGSTTVIHGPDDSAVMLPVGASALDAAFYLFGELALRTKELYMNGAPVAPDQAVDNAATVSATFAREPVAQLRWLHSVHTAVASAIIRTHLSAAPLPEKIAVGRELFDVALRRIMQFRLDELEPSLLQSRMQRLGLMKTDDLYEDIAEGKLEPAEAAMQLLADFRKSGRGADSVGMWVLRTTVPRELEGRVIRAARAYTTTRISTSNRPDGTRVAIRMNLNRHQADEFEATLGTFLPPNSWSMNRTRSTRFLIGAVSVLLLLWGLDPVFARLLLTSGLSAFDLTFVRAVTFFVASLLLYGTQLGMYGKRLRWLSPLHPTLLLSGGALFATALLSYLALSGIAATAYIFCIIAGLLITSLFHNVLTKGPWQRATFALLIILVGIAGSATTLGYTNQSLFAGIGGGLAFALYSELSRRYQREGEAIRARYPAFLFWMSCVGLALAGIIYPLTDFAPLEWWKIGLAVAFALAFSVLPYSLYFEITRRIDSPLIDRSLPLVAIIVISGELVVTSSYASLIVLPALFFFLAYYYGIYSRQVISSAV